MLAKTPPEHLIHPIDLHVGARVRTRRKFMGLSQETLATALGLTFQQVQKYERGSNRISASKLYEIAKALKVPVDYLFDGYAEDVMLEAVDSGIVTLEEEFLAHTVLPNGSTVGAWVESDLSDAIKDGRMPAALMLEGPRV